MMYATKSKKHRKIVWKSSVQLFGSPLRSCLEVLCVVQGESHNTVYSEHRLLWGRRANAHSILSFFSRKDAVVGGEGKEGQESNKCWLYNSNWGFLFISFLRAREPTGSRASRKEINRCHQFELYRPELIATLMYRNPQFCFGAGVYQF